MSVTAEQMSAWEAEVLYWKGRFQEMDVRNAKLVAALESINRLDTLRKQGGEVNENLYGQIAREALAR